MEISVEEALQLGIEAHKNGKVREADRYYTAILKAQPKHGGANHNMGVLAVSIGKVNDAMPFFRTAIESSPNVPQFWASYITALVKLNRMNDAREVFKQAKTRGVKGDILEKLGQRLSKPSKINNKSKDEEKYPQERQIKLLIEIYSQGKFREVLTKAAQLLVDFPKSSALYNIVGASHQALGNVKEAIKSYDRALSINPDFIEGHYNRGNALLEQSNLDAAISAYKKVIALNPKHSDVYYNLGVVLHKLNNQGEAIKAYKEALNIKPDYFKAYNNMGNVLKDQGLLDEAIKAYKEALNINPQYSKAYANLGNALKDKGETNEALKAYRCAVNIDPEFSEAYYNIGIALQEQGQSQEAIDAYKKSISIKPNYAQAYNNMGTALQDQGKLKQAIKAYKLALYVNPKYAEVHRHLSAVTKYTNNDPHFKQVRELYRKKNTDKDSKCHLSFALAKMYEDVGELDEAYKCLTEGNYLRKKLLNYTIDKDKIEFKKIERTQPFLLKSSLNIEKNKNKLTPIFIVGMPRSGTTLAEQIISSHSNVTGAGELVYVSKYGLSIACGSVDIDASALSQFRATYLLELSKVSNGKNIVTDKMPHNFRFIPLICAAFPESKIVHVQRDPKATCWSNFKQFFAAKNLGYSCDLKDLVNYYGFYRHLMKAWRSQYGDRIYDLDYEKLITDQENETRKLVKKLGLKWQSACLFPQKNKRSVRTASQQQVRKMLYQGSSEAWRKYEKFLDGAFDNL